MAKRHVVHALVQRAHAPGSTEPPTPAPKDSLMTKLFNRIAVSTATTGTGTVTLGTAVSGLWLTPSEAGAANGDEVTYVITEGSDFELGRGIYTSSGTTLSRDTVLVSKIGGTVGTSKMNLAGDATVVFTAAAEDLKIERGSNANGEYVKYPDGTLICTKVFTGQGPVSTAVGSNYRSDSISWTFPAAFVGVVPSVHGHCGGASGLWLSRGAVDTNETSASFYIMSSKSAAVYTLTMQVAAIGRWY
jgi:hypothetical protein